MASTVSSLPEIDRDAVNERFAQAQPQELLKWAAEQFGEGLVMTSSFGAQSAVSLHLVTQVIPDVPVVFIDTGYLFDETYRFAMDLTDRLKLNLKVFRPRMTSAWMEAVHGRLWEQGEQEMARYLQIVKIEPMQQALEELKVTAWIAGLRRGQTAHRASLRHVEVQDGRYKLHPILTWSTQDVHEYLKKHDLPYHPLYEQGYASIGDVHSTRRITADQHEREGRFSGLRQECGLHLPSSQEESQSRDSSSL